MPTILTDKPHYDIKRIVNYFYQVNIDERIEEEINPLINTWSDPISNMKMMGMLYLAQSIYLKEFDRRLFGNYFVVGEYGPVIPYLIEDGYVSPVFNYSVNEWDRITNYETRSILDEVWERTRNYSALGVLRAIEDTPAFKELSEGDTIPIEAIKQIDWWKLKR